MVSVCRFTAFFLLYCVTAVTPFIERSEGWSLRSVGVLDQSQQECCFFRRNSNPLQTFQLQPKRETSSSSLGDQLEKRSIISPSNRAICAELRGTSGFRPVPVTCCCAYQLLCIMTISTYLWYVNYITPFPRNVSLGRLCFQLSHDVIGYEDSQCNCILPLNY